MQRSMVLLSETTCVVHITHVYVVLYVCHPTGSNDDGSKLLTLL